MFQGSRGFQPTSLIFINKPSPIEPSNVGQQSEPAGSRQLNSRPNDDSLRLTRDARAMHTANEGTTLGNAQHTSTGRPLHVFRNSVATLLNPGESSPPIQKIVKDTDESSYTLPPIAQQGVKRPRNQIPPVLQALHEPPPNAGLLPSMQDGGRNAHKPQSPPVSRPTRPVVQISKPSGILSTPKLIVKVPAEAVKGPSKRNKWTDEETSALLQGTRKFGVGNWKKILTCPDYSFNHRTATDLKDRFRVVSSNKEMLIHYKIYESYMNNPPDLSGENHLAAMREHRNLSTGSIDMDADLNLPRAKRRQRTKWSEEEDDALLRGFAKYGPSWTSIHIDPVLHKRTPTDIRDRIRTRFSEDYAKAGLAPKPTKPRTQMRSQPKPSSQASTGMSEHSAVTYLPDLLPTPAGSTDDQAQAISPLTASSGSAGSSRLKAPHLGNGSPDESWFSEAPYNFIPAHYANNNDTLPPLSAISSLQSAQDRRDGGGHHGGQTQSIDPLATVLGRVNGNT